MNARVSLLVCGLLLVPAGAFADSLWTSPANNQRPIIADHKACAVGDIVTIVVNENANLTSTQSKQTATDDSVNAAVSQFLFPTTASKFGTHNGALPGITFGDKTAFTGGGSVSNSQSVTSRAAVLVTDVLPNGNLVIEGIRQVTFSGETQHVILHGIIRPDDIAPDDTIASSSIADARIEFVSQGELNDTAKKGWFSRLYAKLRPF
ncbi:flagellar L-ring protein precursor [mine drainage metagenome]|uniref:Flagellar L-ring protein n=1 Tax=mine drainage metagenome TaxID=410659 RepID=A0A1J5TD19_9ZZZZ